MLKNNVHTLLIHTSCRARVRSYLCALCLMRVLYFSLPTSFVVCGLMLCFFFAYKNIFVSRLSLFTCHSYVFVKLREYNNLEYSMKFSHFVPEGTIDGSWRRGDQTGRAAALCQLPTGVPPSARSLLHAPQSDSRHIRQMGHCRRWRNYGMSLKRNKKKRSN